MRHHTMKKWLLCIFSGLIYIKKYFNENIILSSNIKSRVLILPEIYEARETLLMMTACYFPQ